MPNDPLDALRRASLAGTSRGNTRAMAMSGKLSLRGSVLMLLVTFAIILPGIVMDSRAQPFVPGTSADLERFLAAVRAATPSAARLDAVSGTFVFHRARYLLYPRQITLLRTPGANGLLPQPGAPFWRALPRIARTDRARYILGWSLPVLPPGVVRVRVGPGVLVDTAP
jgi:hypothetical protein